MSGKKQKPGLYLQQAGNKLLNMFFHRCSYKISCFSELAYNSSVLCVNLLNCIRSIGTIVITTEIGLNSLEVIFTKQFLTKAKIFQVYIKTPNISSSSQNINKQDLCFPDYLSVSFDYVSRNLN